VRLAIYCNIKTVGETWDEDISNRALTMCISLNVKHPAMLQSPV
jgi:hypothetical protein